ncbi:condensation domain-containing protein [Streptomyces albus]|uniref:condensation domain-containing protein n=1 Tax=Streptomyces albus TaxID=1888 RepID=UPI0033E74106
MEPIPRHLWSTANIARWLPLRAEVTVRQVRAALDALAERHASLRTLYRLPADGTPTQRIAARATGVVSQKETEDTPEARRQLVADAQDRPFTLEDDFGWHATIAVASGRPRGIALTVQHIVADGWAQDLLDRDLAPLLAVQCGGPPATAYDTVSSPAALAVEQRSNEWADWRREAERFHMSVLRSGLLAAAPAAPPLSRLPLRHDGELRLDHLAPALRRRSARLRVFPQGLLLAAAALAVAVERGESSQAWWLMTSNRFNPRWSGLVTSMNQIVPMSADLDGPDTLSQLVQRVQADSAAALRYGCYDVDRFAELCRDVMGGPPTRRYMFNYAVGGPVGVGDHAPQQLESIPPDRPATRTVRDSAPADCYFVVSDEPRLTLRCHSTLPDDDEERMASLLTVYENVLREILARPDREVARLLDGFRTGRAGGRDARAGDGR